MKNIYFFFTFVIIVFLAGSCAIDEADNKPDVTRPAYEMFNESSILITNKMRSFDKVLFLEIYRQLDDSSKTAFNDKYFQQYLIEEADTNLFYLKSLDEYYNIARKALEFNWETSSTIAGNKN